MSKYLKPGIYSFNNGSSYWRIFEDYHEVSQDLDFRFPNRYKGKQLDIPSEFILIESFPVVINTSRFQMILDKI